MIHSMTGFATKTLILTTPEGKKTSVNMSLKSLNTRFFETTFKLPTSLFHLETTLIKLFKKHLYRGHVYFTVYLSNPSIFQGVINPALDTIDAYAKAIYQITERLHITDKLALEHILRLPDIFSVDEPGIDKQSAQIILDAIHELITQVIEVRKQEGVALTQDINKRIKLMHQEIKIIQKRADKFIEEHKAKVHTTLQEIGADESLLAEARKNALYTLLDKIDIHEEITRFASHLEQLEKHLKSDDIEKGKRLDFILQELAREINTITAKCSNATISAHAIDVKVEIEKAREQVQNIV